jgi:S-adenosylmethionine-diacylgycerolhomoserine-N-methlytransferase
MDATLLRSLWQMIRGMPAGNSFAASPDAYRRPPTNSDDVRWTWYGRERLLDVLAPAPGSHVVELGAGAGAMLDCWGMRVRALAALELVEICPPLLERVRRRAQGLSNVRVVEADAADYHAPWPVDCVYFSYALTLMPDWVRALNNALVMLKPGGRLGIVDFYVAGADQSFSRTQYSVLARVFGTHGFRREPVLLTESHLAALCTLGEKVQLHEGRAPHPYLPLLQTPYFVFVGTKPAQPHPELIAELWKKSATPS